MSSRILNNSSHHRVDLTWQLAIVKAGVEQYDGGMEHDALQKQFLDKFRAIDGQDGFYGLVSYADGNIGFTLRKDFAPSKGWGSSFISFYLPAAVPEENGKRLMVINASYGEKHGDSISIRTSDEIDVNSPIDLSSKDYYYVPATNKIFEGSRELEPLPLVKEIYEEHIKPTKPFKGLFLRINIRFWRIFLRRIFHWFYLFFRGCLWLISGDKYSYEPVLRAEVLNGTIIAHSMSDMVGRRKWDATEEFKERPRFKFFEYSASYWVIIVYSIIHLVVFLVFEQVGWRPPIFVTIFKNSFLTLIYVIVTLWFADVVLPRMLRWLARASAMLSLRSMTHLIKI
jgi:hypothetical protein